MTDSFVTQCPHCQTSFRVNHAQLSVARGMVRCGSCLQVFNAARQLLEQRAGKETDNQIVEPPAPTRAISQKQWSAAELDLDNLDLDEELARLEQREIQPAKEFGAERQTRDDALSARRDDAGTPDEHWPDSLFSESAAERADAITARPEPNLAVPPPARKEPEPPKPGRTEPSMSFDLDDLEDEPRSSRLQQENEDPDDLRHEALHTESDDDQEPESQTQQSRTKRNRSEPAIHDDVLLDLVDDPIHLDWQKRRSPWGRRLLWLLLVLIATAALAGQYIAYHFEELARQDQYRPWFQLVCPEIGCSVPSKVDIARIKSSNLVVRSHPEFNGALVVDAILYNRAPFSQPFPLLELRFADLNGHLIASRRFKPGEYLGGEMAGHAEMPPQTPIHIALDILDPGQKAVNYSLSFHSPE